MWRLLVLIPFAGCFEDASAPPPPPTAPTVVSLTFDDTFANQYEAVTLTEERGMRATFFVNSSRIDRPGFLTRDQLAEMQRVGHEIGGHTVHHANVRWIDRDEARRQICDDRVALLELGFDVTTFAYPFSGNDAASRQIVADCGYNAARVVGGIGPTPTCALCPSTAPAVPPDPYRIPTNDSVHDATTLAMLKGYVEQAEQGGGGWVPLVFHHVCDGCNPLAITPAMLAEFLDWLAARAQHGTTVATMRAVLGGETRSAVRGPTPVHARDAYNLLANASLESDVDHNRVPDCWQHGSSGQNVGSYALTSDAADGGVAQRIDVTAWASGARRLVSTQDLGGCARVIDPLRTYVVRARYRSTGSPRFTINLRGPGGWRGFLQSEPLSPSAVYTSARYVIPPLPPEANGISVGVLLEEPGTLTVDAFTLTVAEAKFDDLLESHGGPGKLTASD